MQHQTRVAMMGLGVMGAGMAARLLSAGFPLTVWNRRAERAQPLVGAGASIAGSPREAAAAADVLVSMVSDDEASRAVWLGDSGALAGARPGTLAIECSTVSPGCTLTLSERAGARGCSFLEAPVTGSRTHAASGELFFLVGGDRAVLERARPVLDAMGRDVVYLGPVGSAARMKLVNNFVCGVQAAALAEAIAWIERSGLDRDTALAVLTGGAPGSPLVKIAATRMTTRDYSVNFMLALMRKDLSYAAAEAARQGVRLTTAEAAIGLLDRGAEAGHASRDFSAMVEALR